CLDAIAALLEEFRYEAGPSGLVACADARSRVAVEVLVEQDEVLPVRGVLVQSGSGVHGTASLGVLHEDPRHAPRNLRGYFPQRHQIAGAARTFDLKFVAEIVMELLQRLDQQEIYRKPDRPAPVRVAAEQ